MVSGLDVCDELNEGNAHVDDCDGGSKDEVTGATLLRDDVAKARAEEVAWHDKSEADPRRGDGRTCLSRTGRMPIPCRWKDMTRATVNVWKYGVD